MKKILKEKDGYGTVQRDFMQMDISVYAKCVYTLLRTYSGQNDSCYPSMKTICDDLKISKSTLIRVIKELEKVEMIVVKRSKKNNSNENSVNAYIPLSIMVEIDVEKIGTDAAQMELGGITQTPRGITQTPGVVSEEYRKNNNIKKNKEEEIENGLSPDDSNFSFDEFLNLVNTTVRVDGKTRNFKKNQKAERQFNARIKEGYTKAEFESAVRNSIKQEFHQKNRFMYLTPEFFTRPDKIDLYKDQDASQQQEQDLQTKINLKDDFSADNFYSHFR